MDTSKNDSDNALPKRYDEFLYNKKEEKKEVEETCLNKDNIPIINMPTKGDIIILLNNNPNMINNKYNFIKILEQRGFTIYAF